MNEPNTLPFDAFWPWLMQHPNCILRAGTPEAVLYDDDDLHWTFGAEGPTLVAQLVRGKRLIGEILIQPEHVSYVDSIAAETDGEVVFELISETPTDRVAAWFFVLTHGFGEDDEPVEGSQVH